VLGVLVDAGVLARTPNGAYMRFFPHGADRGIPRVPHAA